MADIFQKSALDELSSPEQLNQQIRVMRPHMWIVFILLAVAFTGFGIWAVFGNINDTTTIEGIVFPQLGVEKVTVQISGTVQDVLYSNGDKVNSGDVIAVVANKKCLEEIELCRAKLEEADGEEKGALEEMLEELESEYRQTSIIRAAKAGTLQNMVSVNESVETGDEIASILISNQASNSREIIGYLPLMNANQLKEGMEAQVCPAYASREEYGYMKGYISSIGTMPVTSESLKQYYGNLEYVKDILPDTSCVEIRIAMYIDEESKNLFSWSNEKGRELTVDVGTICNIQIVTDSRRPLELFLQ